MLDNKNMKQNVTLKLKLEDIEKIKEFYKDFLVPNNGEYILFQAKDSDNVITAYSSKKELYTVTFSGINALELAKKWDKDAKIKESKPKEKEQWLYFQDQIGSDEVGVGDFLLPMIVVAAYLKNEDVDALIKLGIHDSKKMTDEEILRIGPSLVEHFDFSKLTLSNAKYNEMISKGENINSLKAKLHNRALLNMKKKHHNGEAIFIDQFCSPKCFYRYLNDENEEKVTDITFKTKGESSYPSVALASVIARYSLLLEVEKLNNKYKTSFPFGAGNKVDDFAEKFIKKFGFNEFNKIAKQNFKNYKNLLTDKLV